MNELPIVCLTNDKHLWLLRGFCYLFNRYWSDMQPVTIAGYNAPTFPLSPNFSFYSIAPTNYPADQWSNGLMRYLTQLPHDYLILLLEDYWLTRPVKTGIIRYMMDWLTVLPEPNILRVDLSADRWSRPEKSRVWRGRDPLTDEKFDIISTPSTTPYQMSFQAGIWDRQKLLACLQPGENPWQSEVMGSERLCGRDDMIILGTSAHPVHYSPVYRTHRKWLNLDALPAQDRLYIQARGWHRG